MRIKKILLNNIRSYENQEIEFPEGSVLLSGDIGSGKTSILLGIEFALFGLQPGQKGTGILRNGCDSGGVVLDFEVDGKEIKIERSIKRKKNITQDFCSIVINGEKKEIAVTELKSLVLELLSYPKEFAKKQNLLYKFTVYTPQEEMKQIILEDAETRINTLRHVFGIDKYKAILENTSIVISKIREERRMKEGMTANLEQDKSLIFSKEMELETRKADLVLLDQEKELKTEKRKNIQIEKEEISKKKDEKIKVSQEVEKSKLMILTKNETLANNAKTISQLQTQINELKEMKVDESKVFQLEIEIQNLRKERNALSERKVYLASQISTLSQKNLENEQTKNKISKIDMCPTCLQDVGPVHKGNIVNKFDSNSSENNSKISELSSERDEIIKKIPEIEQQVFMKERQLNEMTILRIRSHDLPEKENRLRELEKMNLSINKDIELLKQHIDLLNGMIFELGKFDKIFEAKQRELEESLRQEKTAEIKVAELTREIEMFARQIAELRIRIVKAEKIKEQLAYLTELENWLSKSFVPLVSFTEKNVMNKLKSEFSQLFAEWFGILVPDTFHVRLSDDFTPIIEQHDYELDYSFLSGGERTAIALAYRLSLNQVINSLLSKIKTKDLVILDEPTDGFSDQQLDKMRSVLEQLNVKQLIIVSHEQKIEGFVENIIRLGKEKGVSRIE